MVSFINKIASTLQPNYFLRIIPLLTGRCKFCKWASLFCAVYWLQDAGIRIMDKFLLLPFVLREYIAWISLSKLLEKLVQNWYKTGTFVVRLWYVFHFAEFSVSNISSDFGIWRLLRYFLRHTRHRWYNGSILLQSWIFVRKSVV